MSTGLSAGIIGGNFCSHITRRESKHTQDHKGEPERLMFFHRHMGVFHRWWFGDNRVAVAAAFGGSETQREGGSLDAKDQVFVSGKSRMQRGGRR